MPPLFQDQWHMRACPPFCVSHDRSGQLDAPGAQIPVSFLAPSPRKAKCRPFAMKAWPLPFLGLLFLPCKLWLWTRHGKSVRRNEVTMDGSWNNWVDTERQHWDSFPHGLWILFILGWTPSFMCLESPCCLWCLGLADWLEASLFEEYDSRMSQSVNPFGSVLRGCYNLKLGSETRQVPSIMYTSPFSFQ